MTSKKVQYLYMTIMALVLLAAFVRVHVRIQSTMIGYELGELKKKEGQLLEEKSRLQMELAKISTKSRLSKSAPKTHKNQSQKRP